MRWKAARLMAWDPATRSVLPLRRWGAFKGAAFKGAVETSERNIQTKHPKYPPSALPISFIEHSYPDAQISLW